MQLIVVQPPPSKQQSWFAAGPHELALVHCACEQPLAAAAFALAPSPKCNMVIVIKAIADILTTSIVDGFLNSIWSPFRSAVVANPSRGIV